MRLLTAEEFTKQIYPLFGDKPFTWAREHNINRGVITKIKHGKIPDPRNLLRLSIELNKTIEWLLTGQESPYFYLNEVREAKEEYFASGHGYTCSDEEVQYVKMLIEILRSSNTYNAEALKKTIAAFYKTRNMHE